MDVRIACVCPSNADGQARHPDGDTVVLREKLDFRSAVTARNAIVLLKNDSPDADAADILAVLTETYLFVGIEAWSLADAKGYPLPVTRANIRDALLAHPGEAMTVGDAADELYSASVILPLLAKVSSYSPPTPTNGSTSPTTPSSPTTPKPRKPSSTSTTRTGATATTSSSPVGASSS